ncbi:diguanylate cyclase [Thermomonas sp.]|uniref:diguanylate cyclase n=1 Tax=Thermomonas sp. TaxID=1971895 RepID=UPI0035B2CF61
MQAGFALATPRQSIPDLPQRILLLENSRAYTSMLREALHHRVQLPISVASTLAEARELLDRESDWFLALTGLVLADGDRDDVIDFFVERRLPTIVVSGVYDEELRQRALQQQIIDYVLKSTPDSIDYLVWLVQRLERNRRISALVVDDSLSARSFIASLLAMQGYKVSHVADGQSALRMVEADPGIRLVIVDQEMPGMDGIELTRRLRQLRARDRMAVIGVSGSTDATLIPRFLKNGANDFLRKPFSREEFFCRVSQNIDQLELIGTLQDLATRDFLTGLPNRRSFLENSEKRVSRSATEHVTVAMIDIDHFKHINDNYGHEAGDRALRAMADTLHAHTRPEDHCGRFGGEEFCMLIDGLDADESLRHLEALRQAVSALELDIDGRPLRMTISIGASRRSPDFDTLHKLLGEADRHLYLAKAGGRNQVRGLDAG